MTTLTARGHSGSWAQWVLSLSILLGLVSSADAQHTPPIRGAGENPATNDFAIAEFINARFLVIGLNGSIREFDFPINNNFYFTTSRISADGTRLVGLRDKEAVVLNQSFERVWGRLIQARNPVSLALSPDGEKIIFAAVDRQLHTVNLGIITSTGPEEVVETLSSVNDPGQSWVLSWDEKSQRVVFGWNGQVRILDLNAKTGTNVTTGFDPTWSPNGRWIAYRSTEGRIQLLDVTTGLHKTTSVEANISALAHWSPDSNYIFVDEDYGSRGRKQGCPTNSRFVVYRISDTTRKTVYDPCGLRDWYFGWISDATRWIQAAQTAERRLKREAGKTGGNHR